MRIAICDDDSREHSHLNELLQKYQNIRKKELICNSFYTGFEFIEEIKKNEYDLILLDIVMPGLNGIATAKEIRLFNKIIKIVFLSSSPEFAVDSYSVAAYGYFLKPVQREKLFSLLDQVYSEADNSDIGSLIIKRRESIIQLPFSSIEYVEVMNKTVSFHLTDGSVKDTSAALLDFEPQLTAKGGFLKIHRSYLINVCSIQALSLKGVVTKMGYTIPVSKTLYAQVKEAYMKYLFIKTPKASNLPTIPKLKLPTESLIEHQNNIYRILLIDDEPEQQKYWAHILKDKGCLVDLALNIQAAIELASKVVYDCTLLDVILYGEYSFSHCKKLRELTNAPVIFLSSLTDCDSQLQGFLSGGIDYITKDTPHDLFWAKIEARIRLSRTGKVSLSFEPLVLDLSLRIALVNGIELILTPTEFDLLWILAEHIGRIYTPEELYHAIWGNKQIDGSQSIQVHLSRMRRKLEKACPEHYFIETAWGQGYRFVYNKTK